MYESSAEVKGIRQQWTDVVSGDITSISLVRATYDRFRSEPMRPEFAWAAMICGRDAAGREAIEESEQCFFAALASFTYQGDNYGRILAEAHLAMPATLRGNLDAALRLALAPWSMSVAFEDIDLLALHGIAGYLFWVRDDINSALLHSAQALEIAERTHNVRRRIALLSNIANLLIELQHYQLSADVVNEAVAAADSSEMTAKEFPNLLANAVVFNTHARNLSAAKRFAERLLQNLDADVAVHAQHRALCIYYVAIGNAREARRHCELQRAASDVALNPISKLRLWLNEADVCELEGNHEEAITLAKQALAAPAQMVSRMAYRDAASCLSRCYAKLGRSAESARWKKLVAEHTHSGPLSTIFSSQIQVSLKKNLPNPLTPQELECLTLSARGQTSTDIGLKLGIKPRTVNFHMSKILRKLDAMNRQEAIAKAITANYLKM